MDDVRGQPLLEPLTKREIEVLRLIADGLTDREIAEKLVLSVATVKWHNRQIYGKLGVSNRTQALAKGREHGLLGDEVLPHPLSNGRTYQRHNLPTQVTSFVGRERRINEIKRLIQRVRLLTLTGPPGTGKTRLALRVAEDLIDDFEHGVYVVELAPINRSELVANNVAKVLQIRETARRSIIQSLKKSLSDRELLLLLDNFDHVIEAASVVEQLLTAAPKLKVLVTSREALQLYGEQEYPVPPLTLPDMNRPDPLTMLQQSEAGSLFIQRAQAIRPDFNVAAKDAQVVAEVCVRLDGLPLAIELAAARVKIFSPEALLGQLKSRLTALQTGPRSLPDRQRTLRGAFEWSYELLDAAEKTLFARLSVFQGGCTIEAARLVCDHNLPIEVLDGLESLLNKSLLQQEEGPERETRFVMLETIHEYAHEQLVKMGENDVFHERHVEYFTALSEKAAPFTRGGPHQLRWLRQLEAEHDNLRAALERSFGGGDIEQGLRMVGSLGHFWFRQGHYSEGQYWTTRASEVDHDVSASVHASVLRAAGMVAFYSYDHVTGEAKYQKALTLYRQLVDRREIGWSLIWLGGQSIGRPDEYREAMALLEEGLLLLREVDDKAGVCQALNGLVELTRNHGDHSRATRFYEEGLRIAREIGDKLREGWFIFDFGLIVLQKGDAELASQLFYEALSLAVGIGNRPQILHILAAMAGLLAEQDQPERGAHLLGAVEALFGIYGFSFQPTVVMDIERFSSLVRKQLDEATFNAAWEKGRTMSLEEAVAYGLAKSNQ